MKTYAPSLTNAFAVARPMPLLPPVRSATFASSLPMYFSFVRRRAAPRRRGARQAARQHQPGTRGGPSLDHLVRLLQERRGNRKPERPRRLHVDHEPELLGKGHG